MPFLSVFLPLPSPLLLSLSLSFSLSLSLSLSVCCYSFSAVVRQEAAPPPPSKTTPLHPNGGVPSISSDGGNVAPPPSATVGVNSIPKTDTSSVGTSDKNSKLIVDQRPASGEATPTGGLVDVPTLATTTTSENKLEKDADSAHIQKVVEVKVQEVTSGSKETKTEVCLCVCVCVCVCMV